MSAARHRPHRMLFFGVYRGGSMFLAEFAADVATRLSVPFHSPNGGIMFPEAEMARPEAWSDRFGVIAPIRELRPVPDLDEAVVILMLRDPRDVLTSLYFSVAYSHEVYPGLPERREAALRSTIDEFVLDQKFGWVDWFRGTYAAYCDHLLGRPNVTFVHYEQLVERFDTWLATVLPPLGLADDREFQRLVLTKYAHQFRVDHEDIYRHRRQIRAGDHRRKLRPETIVTLTQEFGSVLQRLGYPR